MRKPKIYIIGQVSGLDPLEVTKKFEAAANHLRSLGFAPLNPIEIVNDYGCPWPKAMRQCLEVLVREGEGAFMLPDTRHSRGGRIESQLCKDVHIPLFDNTIDLRKHFGKYDPKKCDHQRVLRRIIHQAAGCEESVVTCLDCGAQLTDPITDC